MLKFEYHFKENTLYIQQLQSNGSSFNNERQGKEPPQAITKTFSGNYNAQGFILEPVNHWITFTTYPDKIKVFYKEVIIPSQESIWSLEQVNYYRKELPKEEIITFTFTKADQVHKINGVWVKKH